MNPGSAGLLVKLVEARGHSAKVPDQDGIKRLLDPARVRLSRQWADAGYRGGGKDWAEEVLGVEVEVVNRSRKPPPEKTLGIWAREWSKVGHEMDLGKLRNRPAVEGLPRRWVAERNFAGISHNRHTRRITRGLRPGRSLRIRGDNAARGEAVGPRVGKER